MTTVADFNDSYERVISREYDLFFRVFYEKFQASSPAVRRLFANSPESRRYEMLESSILVLIDYSINHVASEQLQQLGRYHAKLGISSAMFDAWMDALVATFKEIDEKFNIDEEIAWRTTLGPGLDYLKCCTEVAKHV